MVTRCDSGRNWTSIFQSETLINVHVTQTKCKNAVLHYHMTQQQWNPDTTISLPEPSAATGDATPEQTDSNTSESNSQTPDPSTELNITRKSYPKCDHTPVVRF